MSDNTLNQPSKFKTKNCVEINDESHGVYNIGSQIKFKNSMLRSSCYSWLHFSHFRSYFLRCFFLFLSANCISSLFRFFVNSLLFILLIEITLIDVPLFGGLHLHTLKVEKCSFLRFPFSNKSILFHVVL